VNALGGLDAILYYGAGIECGVVQAAVDRIYWFFSLRAGELPHGAAAADVLRHWLPRFDAQFRAIAEATPLDQLRLDELLTRPPFRDWGRDRITLLGDAAHPMLPHTAQGAAQALEDAAGLGRALRSGGDPVAALRRYERVRAPRTGAVVRSGPRIAAFAMARHPLARAARTALMRHVPAPLVITFVRGAASDPNAALGPPLTGQ
jgi:2-polyprenyl-6-methoxyphenol hydroxylase-like FAD-dependent oxidoreductase